MIVANKKVLQSMDSLPLHHLKVHSFCQEKIVFILRSIFPNTHWDQVEKEAASSYTFFRPAGIIKPLISMIYTLEMGMPKTLCVELSRSNTLKFGKVTV